MYASRWWPKRLPRNADVADQFDLLADLLELEGGRVPRRSPTGAPPRDPRDAGRSPQLALDGKAKELPGIGATIEEKIVQIVEKGEIEALTRQGERVPPDVVDASCSSRPRAEDRAPDLAGARHHDASTSCARRPSSSGSAALPGLGPKTEENDPQGARREALREPPRTLLGTALPALLAVVDILREHPAADHVSEAGSARRRRETVRDLDIIATADRPARADDHLTELPWVAEVVAKGPTKATVVSHDGLRFDLRVVPPESLREPAPALHRLEGPQRRAARGRRRRGLSISEYGVQNVETGEVFTDPLEEELYAHLGYQFIPPELRENRGELAAARSGSCPTLVEPSDLRGDLHTHTTWSDGQATRSRRWRARRAARLRVPRRSATTRSVCATARSRRRRRRSTRSPSASSRSGCSRASR